MSCDDSINFDEPSPSDVFMVVILGLFVIGVFLFVLSLSYGETHNLAYAGAPSIITNGVEIAGTDGNIYVVCDPAYLDALTVPNTTTYYRVFDGKRFVEGYMIPDVTFYTRVTCEGGT